MTAKLPPLNWLRTFEAAARHRSFTAAADELAITQSAVSQQIKSLETRLGQPLFLRRPRSLELTDAARNYLPFLETAFGILGEGTKQLRGGDADARLDIHANLAFSVFWLMPRIDGFLAANPWVRLNIVTAIWTSDATRPFDSVEIRFGANPPEGTGGDMLTSQHFYPVCTPDIAGTLSQPADLLGLRLADCSGLTSGWEQWLEAAGVAPPEPLPHHFATTYVVVFNLLKYGRYVALGHDMLADRLLDTGELVRPFDLSLPMREAYYLIEPPDGGNSAAKAFSTWLRAQF